MVENLAICSRLGGVRFLYHHRVILNVTLYIIRSVLSLSYLLIYLPITGSRLHCKVLNCILISYRASTSSWLFQKLVAYFFIFSSRWTLVSVVIFHFTISIEGISNLWINLWKTWHFCILDSAWRNLVDLAMCFFF